MYMKYNIYRIFVAKHTTKRSGGPFLVDSLITLQCPDFRIRPAR